MTFKSRNLEYKDKIMNMKIMKHIKSRTRI